MIPTAEFVLGVGLLVYSAEKLIGYLVGVASRWAISLFLVAVVFTGIEFDDLAFGVVLNLQDLSSVALGTVIGTTIALSGVVLALAAIIAPCRVDVPRDYLVLFVGAPAVMFAVTSAGALTLLTGIALVAVFVGFVGWVAYREYSTHRPVWRNAEVYEQLEKAGVGGGWEPAAREEVDGSGHERAGPTGPVGFDLPPDLRFDRGFLAARRHSPAAGLGLAVLALVGLVVGAAVAGRGTGGIVELTGLSGTVFGATIATLALSLEDIFLTVEPVRRGAAEIGVANVIGSVVFSVTGKLGIILLLGGAITVDRDVVVWHLPVLVGITALSAIFLATGRLRRWHGAVLLAIYVGYFVLSVTVFNGIPLDAG